MQFDSDSMHVAFISAWSRSRNVSHRNGFALAFVLYFNFIYTSPLLHAG